MCWDVHAAVPSLFAFLFADWKARGTSIWCISVVLFCSRHSHVMVCHRCLGQSYICGHWMVLLQGKVRKGGLAIHFHILPKSRKSIRKSLKHQILIMGSDHMQQTSTLLRPPKMEVWTAWMLVVAGLEPSCMWQHIYSQDYCLTPKLRKWHNNNAHTKSRNVTTNICNDYLYVICLLCLI